MVAAKCITIPVSAGLQEDWKRVIQELEILKTVSVPGHVNILNVIDHYELMEESAKILWIVTELCGLGSLDNYCTKRLLGVGHHVDIMEQVTSGLEYLHSHDPPIIHRDIKPQNVLILDAKDQHLVKMCDFGVSKMKDSFDTSHLYTFTGTRPYMSPELIRHLNDPHSAQYDKTAGMGSITFLNYNYNYNYFCHPKVNYNYNYI